MRGLNKITRPMTERDLRRLSRKTADAMSHSAGKRAASPMLGRKLEKKRSRRILTKTPQALAVPSEFTDSNHSTMRSNTALRSGPSRWASPTARSSCAEYAVFDIS
jgi:hypothetical protein